MKFGVGKKGWCIAEIGMVPSLTYENRKGWDHGLLRVCSDAMCVNFLTSWRAIFWAVRNQSALYSMARRMNRSEAIWFRGESWKAPTNMRAI